MATQQINATQLALTPQQIQSLSPTDQAQFLNSLSPNQRAIYQQELVNLGNMDFMRNSLINDVFCPVTGGNGPTQNYNLGTTLFFDLPTTAGFAHALDIIYNLTVTPAAGTNATYQMTPAGKYALFPRVELDYNGPQLVTHPYFSCFLLDLFQGRIRKPQAAVLTGAYADSDIDANLIGTTPLNIGANTWKGRFRIRLNGLSRESPYGLLPLSGVGNRPQLKLTTPSALYGTDPLTNAICSGGSGTGQAVTVSGTVQVNCLFRDGKNIEGITPKMLQNWQSMPTVQYYWEQSLTPFNANVLNRFTIANKFEHWYAAAILIDGQQSNAFISGNSNLTSFGLSPDFTAQQYFEAWNIANNISIYDYFKIKVRDVIEQDMPHEGVIPWVVAPIRNVADPDNQNGAQFLNMYAEGFPAASHSYQVGAVGTTTTARCELFLLSKNRQGLKVS